MLSVSREDGLSATNDPVLAALERVIGDLEKNLEAAQIAKERAHQIATMRAEGAAYRQITDEAGRPLVVQLITDNLERLQSSGARLRYEQARALYDEGMTMSEIAALFGVSRQRISAILAVRRRARRS